jgi:N-acetylmuramoyl-L-alanine amidase
MSWFLRLLDFFLRRSIPTEDKVPEEEQGPQDGADEDFYEDVVSEPVEEIEIEVPGEEEVEKMPSTFCWIIDRGHGGLVTNSKRSPKLPDGTRFYEWRFNNIIGRLIAEKLDKLNISYVLCPPNQENVGNYLKGRVDFANNYLTEKAKIFISIHANAGPTKEIDGWGTEFSGVEAWHFYGSPISRTLALIFQRSFMNKLKGKDRGVKSKKTGQFYVLRETDCPAVLGETYFYNNKSDLAKLMNPKVQNDIAYAYVC